MENKIDFGKKSITFAFPPSCKTWFDKKEFLIKHLVELKGESLNDSDLKNVDRIMMDLPKPEIQERMKFNESLCKRILNYLF